MGKKMKRKRGRPKEYENLEAYVKLYYPKEMENKVDMISNEMKISKSEFIRRAIDHYLNNLDRIASTKSKDDTELLSEEDTLILSQIIKDFDNIGIIPIPDNFKLDDMLKGYTNCETRSTKIVAIKTILEFLENKPYLKKFKNVEEFWPIWNKMRKIIEDNYLIY